VQEVSSNSFTPPHPLKTAVLFLVFNRPDTTKQVFEVIRKAKPPRLYVAADGSRADKSEEQEKCDRVRRIATQVDWNCEVKTLFRDKNLGCRVGVSSAIDWFFENEEEGIILEDDCLPNQSFFWFCEELIERYREDSRIMMITGTSYLFNEVYNTEDFFYSRYYAIWGWATWKRAWKKYDIKMTGWPNVKKMLSDFYFWDKSISRVFEKNFELAFQQKIDTWDYQWVFTCIKESGLCIVPYHNLVSNVGCEGTRPSDYSSFINMKTLELKAMDDVKGPREVNHSIDIDKTQFYNIFYRYENLKQKTIRLLRIFHLQHFAGWLFKW
jgi:hypothetical protein